MPLCVFQICTKNINVITGNKQKYILLETTIIYNGTFQVVKDLLPMQEAKETQVWSWVKNIPWRREWQPVPVFLPGKFHGQKSLAGCSLWGCKELDMTEQLYTQAIRTKEAIHLIFGIWEFAQSMKKLWVWGDVTWKQSGVSWSVKLVKMNSYALINRKAHAQTDNLLWRRLTKNMPDEQPTPSYLSWKRKQVYSLHE